MKCTSLQTEGSQSDALSDFMNGKRAPKSKARFGARFPFMKSESAPDYEPSVCKPVHLTS